MSHNSKSYRKKIDRKTTQLCQKIDLLFRQKTLASDENVQGESSSAPKKQDHDSVDDVPMSESSSSSEDETSDIAESVLVPDNRRFDTTKYERSHPWLYLSASRSGYCCKYCEFYFRNPVTDHAYVSRGVILGKHPGRKIKYHENSDNHNQSSSKIFCAN